MVGTVLVDAGFLVALLNRRDSHHRWAATQASNHPPPWITCESALSEAHHLIGIHGAPALGALLRRRVVISAFDWDAHMAAVLRLLQKYADVPISLADACLVRMTEIVAEPLILTTDSGFRIYRRHARQIVPAELPA